MIDRYSLVLAAVAVPVLLLGAYETAPSLVAAQTPASPTVTVNGHEAVAREVLVKFSNAPAVADVQALGAHADADVNVPVGRKGLRRIHSRSFDVETLLSYFRTQPNVLYAEPDYIVHAVATPNDPQFPNLWGLLNTGQQIQGVFGVAGADIHATNAWTITTGSRSNVVGIIDTGIDYTHPDLAANVWSAPASYTVTIEGTSITCPAGSHGFNAITRSCDPMDDNNHGTHVAGTIGAVGNNGTGVTGINWTASIIASKFLNSSGSGTTAAAIDSIDYMIQVKAAFAGTHGANIRVLNNSWGGGGFSTPLQDAISDAGANDMLFDAAAGNNSSNDDVTPFYPASYSVPNIIAIAATDNRDQLAWFSNYGVGSVPLAAPGVDILSTTIGNTYQYFSGTSMATPHVSGAAALVLAACSLDTASLKSTLLTSVDVLGALSGVVSTNGRLNVDRAIRSCAGGSTPAAPTGLSATPADGQVSLTWNGEGAGVTYKLKESTTSGGPYTTIATGLSTPSFVASGLTNGVTYFFVVSAVNASGESPNSTQVSATPSLSAPAKPTKLKAKPGDAKVFLTWIGSVGATSYHVMRAPIGKGPYTTIATVTSTSYTDTSVANGTKYYYEVTAVNAAGESPHSNSVGVTPQPAPAPPTGVTAATGTDLGSVVLTWNASTWASAYHVARAVVSGGPYSGKRKATGLTYTYTGLTSGRRYYFVVTAFNLTGESARSIEVSAIAK